jgi:hypothetical protein
MMPYKAIALSQRLVSFSLDLEEDHSGLSDKMQYEGAEHLPEVLELFDRNEIPLSIFVSGDFLERRGKVIEGLTASQEFHSHGYWHPPHDVMRRDEVRQKNIRDGLRVYESFFKRKPVGYRAPCGVIEEADLSILAEAGVQFDSSFFTGVHLSGFHVFRSARPRWYSSLHLFEIPISAHPLFRLPISMPYLRLMGMDLFSFPQRLGWGMSPLVFNFHLHDLYETSIRQQLTPFWQWIYRGPGGISLMTEWMKRLRDQGARFASMAQMHKELMAKAKDRS